VDLVTTGMIKRAEIRKHLRIAQQLKVGTLALVAVLMLAAYPVYLFTREVAQDPVIGEFDSLNLPGWANLEHSDSASGSRWCISKCRFRQRTWASERAPDETQNQYETSLRNAGWRPRTEGTCAPIEDGQVTCWKRDEYVMDMWVRAPICDLPPPRPVASDSPAASKSPAPPTQPATPACPGALVTMRVWNAIDYSTDSAASS
jgi:integrin beta 3